MIHLEDIMSTSGGRGGGEGRGWRGGEGRMLSTLEGYHLSLGGYHEYIGAYSIHWRISWFM